MKDEMIQTDARQNPQKKHITLGAILGLQIIVAIYTLSGVLSKFAAAQEFMSWPFILLYGGEIAILGIYALLWQQIIKRMDLSIAYANRAIALLWSMLWAVLFFRESISIQNIAGVLIVIAGTIIVNSDHE